MELEERFWSKVDVRGPDECWEWTASRIPTGYGNIKVAGKMLKSHRVAYELTTGPIPDGMVICHSCDNPPCVNPGHLWCGTQQENIADRDAKNRQWKPKGEKHPRVKLSDGDVWLIRRMTESGWAAKTLAQAYGVSRQQIRNIVTGRQRCA